MSITDDIRQIDKVMDVLQLVEKAMLAEAEMNATKHMSETVRPVPLAAAVSSLLVDLEGWRYRLEQSNVTALEPDDED
jgi:hypothetical protein